MRGVTADDIDTELALIVTARNNIYAGGQSFSASQQSITRALLGDLNKRERELFAMKARLNGLGTSCSDFGVSSQVDEADDE